MYLRMWREVVAVLALQSLVTADCPVVIGRGRWHALCPKHVSYVRRPVNIVIIQHTNSLSCSTDEGCEDLMRGIQDFAKEKLRHWDTSASFYVGGNGKIYEGAGWLHAGWHTPGFNSRSFGISFMGYYQFIAPTIAQLDAVRALLKCGVEEGHLEPDYHVVGHRQLEDTESPGLQLYNIIRTWPQWLEDVSSIRY